MARASDCSGRYGSLHVTVICDETTLTRIGDVACEMLSKLTRGDMDKRFGAPVMAVVSAAKTPVADMGLVNAACVLENMVLAATSLGIDNILWAGVMLSGSRCITGADSRLGTFASGPRRFAPRFRRRPLLPTLYSHTGLSAPQFDPLFDGDTLRRR